MFAVGRLKGAVEIVGGEVVIELVEDNLLKKLGEERQVRDRAIVFEVVWVEVVFFEERADKSRFENVGNSACC
jgi:hypothetical protein